MEEKQEFIDWINQEMRRHSWTVRGTAKSAGISHATLSLVLNGEQPSFETCAALAQAFNTSREFVLRLAGLLSPLPQGQQAEKLSKLDHLFTRLSESKQDEYLAMIEFSVTQDEQKEKERLERQRAANRQPRNAQG